MKTMTIRNIPAELAQALVKERQRRGLSLNRTVLALLRKRNALGMPSAVARSNGLRQLAGAWSEAEYQQFEQAVAPFGEIDEAIQLAEGLTGR